MVTFTVSILINKPVDTVVKALMNPDNFPYWTTDLEKFEVIKRNPGEVGSIGHLHYSQKGREYILKDELIYREPDKKYISRVTGDSITARVETILHPVDNNTEMTITWSGKGKIFILKLLLPLLRGKMIKQSKAELETLKRLIETKGTSFAG
jgi:hypothetical protein